MKKNIIRIASLGAIVSAAMAFTACTQLDEPQGPSTPDQKETTEEGTFTVNFECSLPDEDEATRTEFHDKTIWWSAGDQLRFAQYAKVNGVYTYKSTYNMPLTESKQSISISVSSFNTPDENTNAAYFSVFPLNVGIYEDKEENIVYPLINLPHIQKPTNTSFDVSSDLLISQYVTNLTPDGDGKYSVKLKYKRMVAMAKMTIKNLPSSDGIASIVFSAKQSNEDVEIAGSRLYDLVNGAVSSNVTTSCTKEYAITLDYSGQSITANSSTGMTAYFMCYPFELEASDSFKVVVTTTAGEIFTKEVTIPSGRSLEFKEGKGSVFSVDMSTAEMTCEWLSLSPYSSGSYVPTIEKTYAGLKGSDIASVKWCTADMATFSGITDINAYIESIGTDLSSTYITSLNSGTTLPLPQTGTIDTEYAYLVKATNNAGQSVILTTTARTDWFKIAAVTRSSGGILVQITGKGLVVGTKAYRAVLESEVADVTDLSEFYSATVKPGNYAESVLTAINGKNGTSANYAATTDWHGSALVSGQKYVVMMSAKNERGETTFRTAEAVAK